jgi:ribosomal protein L4
VTDGSDENLQRASRNVENVEVTTSDFVNTYQVLRSDKLVFTRGAFQKLEDRLQK